LYSTSKKRLPVLDGELRHHRARPEHIALQRDVVAKDLVKNPPNLQLPIQCLMMRPHPPLHSPIICRICIVPRTFDFVGVAAVALIGLYPLARLKEITQNLVENFNVSILTGKVGTLDPHQVPCQDVDAQLVVQGGHPHVLVGTKGIPLLCNSFLGDAEVSAIHSHQAVIAHIVGTQPALKDDLWLRGQRRWGCEDGYE
jgi:hypothetical protein